MRKVIGIGMSKTGTKTLGACLDTLGFTPRCSFRGELKRLVWGDRPLNPIGHFPLSYDPDDLKLRDGVEAAIMKFAAPFCSFDDSPWYMLFRQLDRAFPGSRFILTLRSNARVRAESNWAHNVRAGNCVGPPDPDFIEHDMATYERHNAAVRRYFADRPGQLLEVCWEAGDAWPALCEFLDVPVPNLPFPHRNKRMSPADPQ